jgi:thiol-disulfide isomerase/thioredoxin
MWRRASTMLAVAAVTASAACGADDQVARSSAQAGAVPGAKDPLADVRAQANHLLGGGPQAFEAWIAALRGHPVVVNQWASWCGPCRFEFPFFRDQARKLEGRVAFLGVDSKDSREQAEAFLRELPVPFPHFFDEDGAIARLFRGGRSWPTTAFYDASGELAYTHQGSYASEAKLEADVQRYALR